MGNMENDNLEITDSVVEQVDLDWLNKNRNAIRSLALDQTEPTPFSTCAWLEAWWDIYSNDHEPVLLVVISNNKITGFFPFMRTRRAKLFDILEWFAAGRSDHSPMLLRRGSEAQTLAILAEYIKKQLDGWDALSLRTLQTSQKQLLEEYFLFDNRFSVTDDVTPALIITGSWDEHLKTKSKRHRGNIKRMIRQADGFDDLFIECVGKADKALVKEIVEVESKSWKASDGNLRLSGKGFNFYISMFNSLASDNMLELWLCRYRGKLVSYIITFRFAERVYYYNGAFLADYRELSIPKSVSPGTILLLHALRSAHDRNILSFDFLRGDEPYKEEWCTSKPLLSQIVICKKGIKGKAVALLLFRIRWWLRRYPLIHWIRKRLFG